MMHFTTRNHQSNTLSIILNNVIAGIRNIYIIWMLRAKWHINAICQNVPYQYNFLADLSGHPPRISGF